MVGLKPTNCDPVTLRRDPVLFGTEMALFGSHGHILC